VQDNRRFIDDVLVEALNRRHRELGGLDEKGHSKWNLVARSLGVYPSYIAGLRKGTRVPGPAILEKLGLRRVISYERVKG
jgi:hypothetical protein